MLNLSSAFVEGSFMLVLELEAASDVLKLDCHFVIYATEFGLVFVAICSGLFLLFFFNCSEEFLSSVDSEEFAGNEANQES